ncbi:hypothetical protein BC832DRAFT_465774 [Gaertneriomyces semiglobifer]|nr:hypothetical protein BC832DRAFT_465774 [Gaertneriomyces semiglobifer]
MTRTHGHSSGPKAAVHDRHASRSGGDPRGEVKKNGAGRANWGTATDTDDLPLYREFGDSNFPTVGDEEQIEALAGVTGEAAEKKQSSQVARMNVRLFPLKTLRSALESIPKLLGIWLGKGVLRRFARYWLGILGNCERTNFASSV